MTKKILYILLTFIPPMLVFIYFNNIVNNSFLFIHDELLLMSRRESFQAFFTLNPASLGLANTTTMFVTFFERIFYFTIYFFTPNILIAEKISYLLKLYLLIFFPYIGFQYLSKFFNSSNNPLNVLIISLWYSFNTYTLIYWHGNAFSLTLLIAYVLAPIAFYFYHRAIFSEEDKRDKYITSILFFFMSFALYLFAVFIIFIALYTILYAVFLQKKWMGVIKNLILLIIIFIPFLSIIILIPYEMFITPVQTLNLIGGETYGNLRGGLLYQLLMWFSWGIYTFWTPRNIFTFDAYFKTFLSLIAPFVIYALLLPELFRRKKKKTFYILFFIFLIFLFFIKGGQEPFGDIYNYLLQHFAPFRLFRSPDNKFGFGIILILSILLLHIASSYRKLSFILLMGFVILVQGFLIFNGVAVRGENTASSSDRIVTLPREYTELASYINSHHYPYGYIMPIPSVEFGHYSFEQNKRYIGQDILPKLISLPFLYTSTNSGISSNTFEKVVNLLQTGDTKALLQLPVRYFLIRTDTSMQIGDKTAINTISQNFKPSFKNRFFVLYENPNVIPIVQSKNISFIRESPISYRILFRNLKSTQNLLFLQSYNPNWVLYPMPVTNFLPCNSYIAYISPHLKECIAKQRNLTQGELGYLFMKPVFSSTHTKGISYANTWAISPEDVRNSFPRDYYSINPDGSINIQLTLYYKTQTYFYYGVIIAFGYLLFIIGYLFFMTIRDRKGGNVKK